jgi:serine/threonine protein kinase
MFRAERIEDNAAVAVLILHSSLVGRSELFTRLEQEVRSLQQLKHPAFQRILSLEYTDAHTFLLLEWIEGPALLDLLRTRRALPASEAKLLLSPLADAFDEPRIGRPGVSGHRCARNSPAGSGCRPTGHFLARVSAEVFGTDDNGLGLGFTRGDDGCVVVCAHERKGSIHG